MAKKLTPGQVVRELNDIVFTFSGKSISSWVQEAWEKSQKTTIGQAAAGVERGYRQLSFIYHPDKEGGDEGAMKLLNSAYEQIKRIIKGG